MNENLQPQTPTIKEWLTSATASLTTAGISSARLDGEIILAHCLNKPRTYLHAHHDERLSLHTLSVADARIDLRRDHVPIAYIIGHKEFYGRHFKVTPAVLIPRPESEDLIESVKALFLSTKLPASSESSPIRLVDVGTGSGCLGITLKLELPFLNVTLLDVSPQALRIAGINAHNLKADVHILASNLLSQYPLAAQLVVANLPYVDKTWKRSPETAHEPALALFSERQGLALIEKLIAQATHTLLPGAHLLLEADPSQHGSIQPYANTYGFSLISTRGYAMTFQKA